MNERNEWMNSQITGISGKKDQWGQNSEKVSRKAWMLESRGGTKKGGMEWEANPTMPSGTHKLPQWTHNMSQSRGLLCKYSFRARPLSTRQHIAFPELPPHLLPYPPHWPCTILKLSSTEFTACEVVSEGFKQGIEKIISVFRKIILASLC